MKIRNKSVYINSILFDLQDQYETKLFILKIVDNLDFLMLADKKVEFNCFR